MRPVPHEAERSVARSRNRRQVLLVLASLGEAYVGQLSRITGLPHRRVRACLVGADGSYRPELSLLRLGLARESRGPVGRYFAITSKGLRKARSLTASAARRAQRGRSVRDLGRET